MALTQSQKVLIAKVKAVGASEMAVALDDEVCCYLVGVVIHDLGLQREFPKLIDRAAPFFGTEPLSSLRLAGHSFVDLFDRLVTLRTDADIYFYCLATLHKARLKYERILQSQPLPTIDQVGPRCLLQFGSLSPGALASLLFWRKWIFDTDNRASQETGYLFEPIIANAIGGVPVSAKKSPIRRRGGGDAGRQADCVREIDKRAYEIKLRVTIAASGQGRWQEELDFPEDCRSSGYTPVLIVLDPTANPKLTELQEAFIEAGGEFYAGEEAWNHLGSMAGCTMATFLHAYVHLPIQALFNQTPVELPEITFSMVGETFTVTVAGEKLIVERSPRAELADDRSDIPEDVNGESSSL